MASRSELRARWSALLREHEASGLTGIGFCRQRGIPPRQFYRWRRRFRDASAGSGQFVTVSFAPDRTDCGIAVAVAGIRLELSEGFIESELVRAIRALRLLPC